MSEGIKVPGKAKDKANNNSTNKRNAPDLSLDLESPVGKILSLQRTIGNGAMQNLIESGILQTKLKIGKPGDKYELEADRMAEQVMRMTVGSRQKAVGRNENIIQKEEKKEIIQTKPLVAQITPLVQRQNEEEEKKEEELIQPKLISEQITPSVQQQVEDTEKKKKREEEMFQAKEDSLGGVKTTTNIESSINSLKGKGEPLPESIRSYFEPKFGYDFSGVRVHTGNEATETTSSINARAFALGSNVVFGGGAYAPETFEGKRLLAHELTHVIQQSASPILQKLDNSIIQRQADLTKAPSGLPCTLKTGPGYTPGVDILFSVRKDTISPADKTKLATFATTWIANGSRDTVFVDGYASTDGAQSTNWRLSCKRAKAVKDELVKCGVSSSKIILIAHGESTEFSTTDATQNRRTVVSMLSTPSPPTLPSLLPPQPSSILLKSIKFTSDHGLLNDNNSNWSDAGTIVEPEWITNPVRNKAISQTKGSRLTADITVNIGISGDSFDLIGEGVGGNDVSFKKTGNTSTGSDQLISITADGSLPNAVSALVRFIVWKIKKGNKEHLAAFTGPHRIYVTYASPTGGVATEKRMRWSTLKATGKNSPGDIADAIGPHAVRSAIFGSNFNLANPWTALATNGDCGTLSTLMKRALEILGVTGAEIRFVYARHSSWTNLWTYSTTSNERSFFFGHKLGFISGGWNNYEGTCFFNSKWWMGGAGTYRSTPLGVLLRWTLPNNNSVDQRQVWDDDHTTPVSYPPGVP